ncbi:NUDIX domain-containing protein [Lysobacter sp. TY2-98]|uniref:NUDIX domain-containing protein n=1 Tax=Lysobacter sp. TY2-98 TaxID=2290922 RepID=UPI000E202520|nr:NUDIX domain-containing protein [Lysobacter sp. TY2-98]AXK72083.1 NUDIX domain-containing protein [Lysobacter sp. TY2-98]
MPQESAGILLYRKSGGLHVLLAHPGGPFWQSRDDGAWSIPKGGPMPGETPEQTARREFEEELGAPATGTLEPLGRLRQKGGKWVEAFAMEGDFDPDRLTSIMFRMEWPPRSGRFSEFPEVDRAQWFAIERAREKMLESQRPLLDRLDALVNGAPHA